MCSSSIVCVSRVAEAGLPLVSSSTFGHFRGATLAGLGSSPSPSSSSFTYVHPLKEPVSCFFLFSYSLCWACGTAWDLGRHLCSTNCRKAGQRLSILAHLTPILPTHVLIPARFPRCKRCEQPGACIWGVVGLVHHRQCTIQLHELRLAPFRPVLSARPTLRRGGGPRPFLGGWVSCDPPTTPHGGRPFLGGWVLGPGAEFFFAFAYRVVVKVFCLGGWVGGVEPPPPPPWG